MTRDDCARDVAPDTAYQCADAVELAWRDSIIIGRRLFRAPTPEEWQVYLEGFSRQHIVSIDGVYYIDAGLVN